MKKMRRLLCLLLAVMMVLASACSKAPEETKTDDKKQETTTETKKEETKEEISEEDSLYPLSTTGEEISFWIPYINEFLESPNDVRAIQEIEKITGVHVDWIVVSQSEASEKFGLMLASGDYPDVVWDASYYPGGVSKGVDDGVYMDLTDLIPQYMPNYTAIREENEEVARETITDDGKLVCVWTLPSYNGEVRAQSMWSGYVVRKDWLDELGMDLPVTIDDWHEMLVAFKENYGCDAALQIPGDRPGFNGTFLSAYGVMPSFYQDNGVIKFGPAEQGYKDYLDLMRQWYAEGLIDPNYPTSGCNILPIIEYVANERTGACPVVVGQVGNMFYLDGYTDDPDFFLQAVPNPVINEGDQSYSSAPCRSLIKNGVALTTDCRNPELTLKWLDYFYSYEGSMMLAYGPEGEGYVMENGEPKLTDAILNHPDGLTIQDAYRTYSLFQSSFGLYNLYPETLLNADVNTFAT